MYEKFLFCVTYSSKLRTLPGETGCADYHNILNYFNYKYIAQLQHTFVKTFCRAKVHDFYLLLVFGTTLV